MEIHLHLDTPPERAAERARDLAAAGADGVFTFEGPHDAFLPLALATTAADLPIMTNVAIALPRSPLHLAHLAHDLQRLSGGRFTLGLGSQVKAHIERRYGSTWSRPAARMREIVHATREILTAWQEGRPPDVPGHTHMPPTFVPPPLEELPKIMMGAFGPVMTRTAGEVADGLLVVPFNTRQHLLERTLPLLREGAERAGREDGEIAVVPEIIVAVGTTPAEIDAATDGARALVAFYGSTPAYRAVLELEGRGGLQPRLREFTRTGAWAAMGDAIDDDLFDAIAVRGTPAECAAKIRAKFDGIGDRVCAYFPGSQPDTQTLTDLAAAVHAV